MDNRNEIRQFLTSRRARITAEQAGLPTYGGNRRVAGLRREEVALLAGVSVDYYTRLERGNLGGVSEAGASASVRVGVAAVVGACAGPAVSVPATWQLGTLAGWDAAAVVYLAWTWTTIWRRDATATARLAVREDPGRATADALLLVASVASLLAVALVITAGSTGGTGARDARAALAVASVVLSWTVVHTVYSSRYARLYYTGPSGGIDFNQQTPPRYSDFAYLAFTIGMTFQVSDTDLQAAEIRATALRHALLSYLLGAIILATTINLVSGLLR